MRTTVTIADDVAAALEKLRRQEGLSVSEGVNELARRGLSAAGRHRRPFRQKTAPMGLRVDVTSVADALEALDGP